MAKKRKQNLPPRRKRMKRPQRLESAKSWLETYEGNKVVKAYRKSTVWISSVRSQS